MSFKLKTTGFNRLNANLKTVARQISPQVGLASGLADGAQVIASQAQRNAERQGLLKTGELIANIKPIKINQYRVDIIVGVPYGAAHEFGVTVTVTPKQRRFFWAMYINTRDDMWKALALSITYTIPARPYLRPAMDAKKKAAYGEITRSLVKTLDRQLK